MQLRYYLLQKLNMPSANYTSVLSLNLAHTSNWIIWLLLCNCPSSHAAMNFSSVVPASHCSWYPVQSLAHSMYWIIFSELNYSGACATLGARVSLLWVWVRCSRYVGRWLSISGGHREIALGARDSGWWAGTNSFSPELADSTSPMTGQGNPHVPSTLELYEVHK